MILKDKFLSQCALAIRIKLQQLQQQDSASSSDEMVQTATNTCYNREQEKEAKAQEREKRKETRHVQTLAPPLQGSPMANPKSLKDKAGDKCLICRQVGHRAKECPNHDKSPQMACYKCHQLEHWVALCPRDPRASMSSTKPSLTMVQ